MPLLNLCLVINFSCPVYPHVENRHVATLILTLELTDLPSVRSAIDESIDSNFRIVSSGHVTLPPEIEAVVDPSLNRKQDDDDVVTTFTEPLVRKHLRRRKIILPF